MAGMNLRCSPGDLALVISGHDRSLGQSVTCVRLVTPGERMSIGGFDMSLPTGEGPCWLVEPSVLRMTIEGETTEHYVPAPYYADRCLMPIRPRNDDVLTDETERLAGFPDRHAIPVRAEGHDSGVEVITASGASSAVSHSPTYGEAKG